MLRDPLYVYICTVILDIGETYTYKDSVWFEGIENAVLPLYNLKYLHPLYAPRFFSIPDHVSVWFIGHVIIGSSGVLLMWASGATDHVIV